MLHRKSTIVERLDRERVLADWAHVSGHSVTARIGLTVRGRPEIEPITFLHLRGPSLARLSLRNKVTRGCFGHIKEREYEQTTEKLTTLLETDGEMDRRDYVVFLRATDGKIAFLREYFDPVPAAKRSTRPFLELNGAAISTAVLGVGRAV